MSPALYKAAGMIVTVLYALAVWVFFLATAAQKPNMMLAVPTQPPGH